MGCASLERLYINGSAVTDQEKERGGTGEWGKERGMMSSHTDSSVSAPSPCACQQPPGTGRDSASCLPGSSESPAPAAAPHRPGAANPTVGGRLRRPTWRHQLGLRQRFAGVAGKISYLDPVFFFAAEARWTGN